MLTLMHVTLVSAASVSCTHFAHALEAASDQRACIAMSRYLPYNQNWLWKGWWPVSHPSTKVIRHSERAGKFRKRIIQLELWKAPREAKHYHDKSALLLRSGV